jgi:hypothetical protein
VVSCPVPAPSATGGAPCRPVGADRDGVAARVVADAGAGVEHDLAQRLGTTEVDLQVLAGLLRGAGRVAGAGVVVDGVGGDVALTARIGGAGRVRGRVPAGRIDRLEPAEPA